MTDEEAMATVGLPSREAAVLISAMRGATKPGISLAQVSQRRVSDFWVRQENLARKHGLRENPVSEASATMRENPVTCAIQAPVCHQGDRSIIENGETRSQEAEITAPGNEVDTAQGAKP